VLTNLSGVGICTGPGAASDIPRMRLTPKKKAPGKTKVSRPSSGELET